MKIKPLHDWVLLEAGEAEERTAGGIIIPEVAKEKPQWGIVAAAGPGAYKTEKGMKGKREEKKFVPTEVKKGDKVLYEKYMASEFELDGEKVIMVREENVLGLLEQDKTALQKKAAGEVQKKAPSAVQKKAAGAVEKKKAAPKKKK